MISILRDLRSYYGGSRDRDQREFYDLESRLPYFDSVNRILGRHKRRVFLEFLRAPRHCGDPILEVGCGVGTFARALARRGHCVVGIDISQRKIERARALNGRSPLALTCQPVDFHVGDLRELGEGGGIDQTVRETLRRPGEPAPTLEFSRIVAADVVEHIPWEPARTAQKLNELLVPGGQLLVSVPSRLCLHDPGHIWKILPREWEAVFDAAGFRLERRRMSRICWYRLGTPLPLAMVLDLRKA